MEEALIQYTTLERSLDRLSLMAQIVKRSLEYSLQALFESDSLAGYTVIEMDKSINSYEIDIDNMTYKLFAGTSIEGDALRAVISIQKINPILERIGDHAVNIAESAISIAVAGYKGGLFCLPEMAKTCTSIFYEALDSYFCKNIDSANEVLGLDDSIDFMNRSILKEVQFAVLAGSLSFETALDIIRVSKNLERIADLSMNIAEETTFALSGHCVKHSKELEVQKI